MALMVSYSCASCLVPDSSQVLRSVNVTLRPHAAPYNSLIDPLVTVDMNSNIHVGGNNDYDQCTLNKFIWNLYKYTPLEFKHFQFINECD